MLLFEEGAARTRGTPSEIANSAARGKLRTEVTEIIVEAKQRLNDLSNSHVGAESLLFADVVAKVRERMILHDANPNATTRKSANAAVCKNKYQQNKSEKNTFH
jgi:hypothetical protein